MSAKNISIFTASLLVAVSFVGCNKTTIKEPTGLGYEQTVALPNVNAPLPTSENLALNSDGDKSIRYSINNNPVAYLLKGMNSVWKGTTDDYQNAASGNGPSANDLIANPIIDANTWATNIKYVVDVTTNRTDDEAILAFLDDRRSKNYSVIDGFGPLTEDYVAAAEASVNLANTTVAQVVQDENYAIGNNDSQSYGGNTTSTLGAVVQLVRDFRNNSASTSASKYIYSTPRPWRMNDTGEIDFQGTTITPDINGSYTGSDGTMYKGTYKCTDAANSTSYKVFDIYESSVKVVPGLVCSRRAHSTSKEGDSTAVANGDKLYSADTENRRKDGGYPSGHTNAGVLASIAYAYSMPERFSELVTRGSQLGESRIVAGMHSPVDIIGGRVHALAISANTLNNYQTDAQAALAATKDYFGTKAANTGMTLNEYAHTAVSNPTGYSINNNVNFEVFNNNIYDNKTKNKETYRFRMTYGFEQDITKAGQAPIVPKGAEVLLASRFPYLTDVQRRAVIATTEIDSGYPILDETNGWGRIDLVTAADGYGAFNGDVNVTMDATLGRLNAKDTWGNNITGKGLLTKNGTGKLTLEGNNTYSGGTVLNEGTLEATSSTAFGTGDVYVKGGIIEVSKNLVVKNHFTQKAGVLQINVASRNQGKLTVGKQLTIKGGSLVINFDGITPVRGDSFKVINANYIKGRFSSVTANGYNLSYIQTNSSLIVIVK